MFNDTFRYAHEKFSTARRSLMLPHPGGEARSIASAFWEISIGLKDIDRVKIADTYFLDLLSDLDTLMDDTGIVPTERGTLIQKAETLNDDEKRRLSHAVDELTYYFGRYESE